MRRLSFTLIVAILNFYGLTGGGLAQDTSPVHLVDGASDAVGAEYIREWLVLGPLFEEKFETDLLADVGGEARINPKEGDIVTTADGTSLTWARYKLTWKPYQIKVPYLDFREVFKSYQLGDKKPTVYAFCILRSEAEKTWIARLGCSGSAAVWINGQQVNYTKHRGRFEVDADAFPINLKAGSNRCLVRFLHQASSGSWNLSMGVISGTTFSREMKFRSINEIQRLQSRSKKQLVAGITLTILIALGGIHLLLYLFYPVAIKNLYFAIFSAVWAVVITFILMGDKIGEEWVMIAVYGTFIAGLRFLYSVFYPRLPRQFILLLLSLAPVAVLMMALDHILTADSHVGLGIFIVQIGISIGIFAPLFETCRVIWVAARKKREGASIIGTGFVISIYAFLLPMIRATSLGPEGLVLETQEGLAIIMFSPLGILIAMSIYLARDFAQTQRALERSNAELAESYNRIEETLNELQQTQAQLILSEKLAGLGQLVAGVAHEINNPVNFISSSLNPLERNLNVILQIFDELDQVYELQLPELEPVLQRVDALAAQLDYEEAREAIPKILSAMREGTDRTTEIVKSLRLFARHGGAGKASADLHTGLDATLTLLQNRIKRGIVVHKDYGSLPQVTCDAGQINQVFMNLLTNAADAIEAEGEIFITTRRVGENVEIRVRDTGCGIPAEIKEKLFDPFFSTKEVGSGMGLGLWICHQIVVEGHGGKIDVESEVGKGSEFIVTLPIQSEATLE